MSDDKKESDKPGSLLSFPGGHQINTSEFGANHYVVGQSGHLITPELQDPLDIERELKDRERFLERQELLRAVSNKSSTSELIDVLLREIAEETSHLKFERDKAIKSGKIAVNFNLARIQSLKTLTDILIKRKDADSADHFDLKSPRFQKIFKLWLEFVHESMDKSGVSAEIIDLVFKQMKVDMKDWESRLESA